MDNLVAMLKIGFPKSSVDFALRAEMSSKAVRYLNVLLEEQNRGINYLDHRVPSFLQELDADLFMKKAEKPEVYQAASRMVSMLFMGFPRIALDLAYQARMSKTSIDHIASLVKSDREGIDYRDEHVPPYIEPIDRELLKIRASGPGKKEVVDNIVGALVRGNPGSARDHAVNAGMSQASIQYLSKLIDSFHLGKDYRTFVNPYHA